METNESVADIYKKLCEKFEKQDDYYSHHWLSGSELRSLPFGTKVLCRSTYNGVFEEYDDFILTISYNSLKDGSVYGVGEDGKRTPFLINDNDQISFVEVRIYEEP